MWQVKDKNILSSGPVSMVWLLPLIAAACFLSTRGVADAQCTLCADGNPPPRPDLPVSGDEIDTFFPNVTTCGELAASPILDTVGLFVCQAVIQRDVGVAQCDCVPSDEFCSVCPDRSVMSNPDALAEEPGVTCRDLALEAAFEPDFKDPDSCVDYHTFGFLCGCPVPDYGGNSCSLCQGGESSPTPDTILFGEEDQNITCLEAEQVLPYLQAYSTTCKIVQLEGAYGCECPVPQQGLCGFCPDGSLFPEPDTFLPDAGSTCFDYASIYQLFSAFGDEERNVIEDDCSFFFLDTARGCGCPEPVPDDTTCRLCPGGELSDPDLVIPGVLEDNQTCSDLDTLLLDLEDGSDVCRIIQSGGGAPCGCPFEEITCTVCPDGSELIDPSLELDVDFTCQDVEILANADPEGVDCEFYHVYASDCQCPLIEGGCTLCWDGSDPTLPDAVFDPSTGETCQDIADIASYVSSDGEICTSFVQFIGSVYCGCPPLEGVCTLCADGSNVPDPSLVIDDFGTTCGDLQNIAAVSNETECSDFEIAGAFCGCPALDDGGCSTCFGGANYTGVPRDVGADDPTPTCMERENFGASINGDTDLCGSTQASNFFDCGCPELPPIRASPLCTLCPTGELPANLNFSFVGNSATCGDYYVSATHISNEFDCDSIQEAFAGVCGCPGVEIPELCTLCEDGSAPPVPSLEVVPGETCESLSFVAQDISTDFPDTCVAFQATAGVYCGCNNPIASEGYCRICGGTKLLPEPGRDVVDPMEGTLSCGEAEFAAFEDCAGAQASYAEACCDTTPTALPTTVAPTAAMPPTTSPPPTAPPPNTSGAYAAVESLLLSIVASVAMAYLLLSM